MQLAREASGAWHFAEPDHCGWARTFDERGTFEERIEVSSVDEVGVFCSMCRDRHGN